MVAPCRTLLRQRPGSGIPWPGRSEFQIGVRRVSRIIERAFELASESASLKELRDKLRLEGFGRTEVEINLSGRLLKSQLNGRMLPTNRKRRAR